MAAALVGGAFLSATLQVLFDRLASREVLNFFRERKLDDGLLKKLRRALLTINVVLDDAEEKEFTDESVKDWLDELKDAVYRADDFLDEIATETMRRKFEAEYQSGTNQKFEADSLSSTKQVRCDIDVEIKQIIEELECFANQKDVLGLKNVERKPLKRLPTTSLVDESAVYGRDRDREKIINLLLRDDDVASKKTCVIPIVGMGGIGKTTLAQYAYNDRRVDVRFDIKAWVCVSEEFDVFRVTKTILAAVGSSASDVSDLNLLQVNLREKLSGKKFLIVLDDLWNENYDDWDKLRAPFRDGEKGSKIIVTTRSDGVASIMRTVPSHPLEPLSDEDCWSLLAKHAFESGDLSAHPNLESIGKEIVKKCKGLPLVAKTLGGLLRSKLDVEEWENILNSSIWDLPQDKNYVLQVLRLSYHYLPSNLKRCFAYCSIYPKDYEFEKEELVLLWIAHGFVPKQPKGNREIEEEGGNYFCELLSRSFFQRSSARKSHFVMHDLVHDLSQLISGEFCFRLDNDKEFNVSEKVRHFSYFCSTRDMVEKFNISDVKCLRTFFRFEPPYISPESNVLDDEVLHNILSSLRCLRVLSLSGYEILELPPSIENLTHLRYLDLSFTGIKKLPDSITTLWNLQTLNLSDCRNLRKLPVDLSKLVNLRHLNLSGCHSLSKVPVDLWKLVNLRHLYIRGTSLTEMPMHMSRIKGLQHLCIFVVGRDTGRRINELSKLCHLRGELSIQNLQNVTNGADALEANMKDKKHLLGLELRWSGKTDDTLNERDVLDKLQPHVSVKKLTINYYGGTRFPDWLGEHSFSSPKLTSLCGLKNLEGLVIDDCPNLVSFPNSALPFSVEMMQCYTSLLRLTICGCGSLESLYLSFPKLEFLSIGRCTNFEELWVPNEIQNLASLEIFDCPSMVSFPRAGLPAPKLTNIWISKCNNLKWLPEGMHLQWPSLEDLEIDCCPELESFPDEGLPSSLLRLSIRECKKLESFPEVGLPSNLLYLSILNCKKPENRRMEWCLRRLPNLESFEIGTEIVEDPFPQDTLLPSSLTSLSIKSLPNLKSLNQEAFQQFTSLKKLRISNCPNLQSLPEGLPTSLSTLVILNCPLLKPRCEREKGEDWSKISHIDFIRIS